MDCILCRSDVIRNFEGKYKISINYKRSENISFITLKYNAKFKLLLADLLFFPSSSFKFHISRQVCSSSSF